jgi:hypothetical protein
VEHFFADADGLAHFANRAAGQTAVGVAQLVDDLRQTISRLCRRQVSSPPTSRDFHRTWTRLRKRGRVRSAYGAHTRRRLTCGRQGLIVVAGDGDVGRTLVQNESPLSCTQMATLTLSTCAQTIGTDRCDVSALRRRVSVSCVAPPSCSQLQGIASNPMLRSRAF